MKLRFPHVPSQVLGWLAVLIVAVLGFSFSGIWVPAAEGWVKSTIGQFRTNTSIGHHGAAGAHDGEHADDHTDDHTDDHAEHGHAHDDTTSLELSVQARRNIGLTDDLLDEARLQTFRRSITVPAIIVERPGRTQIHVATPMTGVITHVHAVSGEAVQSETLLFQIRLTHEDLVQAQTEFLKTIGELDVERREIQRLSDATSTGAVAKIKLLERQYSEEKLEALLRAQREALRLHGLSEEQVERIATDRRLLRELQIIVPYPDQHEPDELRLTGQRVRTASFQQQPEGARKQPQTTHVPLVISDLKVHKGQAVNAGETLCILSDMRQLFIEGHAFQQDTVLLEQAAAKDWPVQAILPWSGNEPEFIDNLRVVYLDNHVNAQARALRFYVSLPNTVVHTSKTTDGQYFISWRFKPGQRMQLRIPVEEWPDRIVLPVNAVAKEGAEYYVFVQNGDHFDRQAVHVEHRDQFNVVIANDGSIFPGDTIAMTGAHQMQMALKNKSGGAVDPHAGHSH